MRPRDTPSPSTAAIRERIALRIAPWLYLPYREDREEAFRDLAEAAYGDRDVVWTSPRVLVKTALRRAAAGQRPADAQEPRCGPWDERSDGAWVCRKCGEVDIPGGGPAGF
jgi:hypothetical protein